MRKLFLHSLSSEVIILLNDLMRVALSIFGSTQYLATAGTQRICL